MQIEHVKAFNYSIDTASCSVLTMMQYFHRLLLTQSRNRRTAICRQILEQMLSISVRILFITIRIYFFVNTMIEIQYGIGMDCALCKF